MIWPSSGSNEARWRLIFLAFCFFTPLVLRLYALWFPFALNPDEAQWTVSARRILEDPVIWRSNDLTTSGPLNGLTVGWPHLLGLTPSLLSSRITGLLLQSAALLGVAGLVRRDEVLGPAGAAGAITALFLGLLARNDYIHYSSEDLSILLMALFCVVYSGISEERPSAWRWAACGFLASCLPFAKLQSSVIFLLFHLVCAARLGYGLEARTVRWPAAAAYLAAASAPFLLLIGPLYLVGEQQAVLEGYFGLGSAYGGVRSLAIFLPLMPFILVMAVLMSLIVAHQRGLRVRRPDYLALGLGLWPAVFLTIWWPGRPYPHYNLYAIVGLPLAVVLTSLALPRLAEAPRPWVPRLAAVVAAGFVVGAWIFMSTPWRWAVERAAMETAFASKIGHGASRPLLAWTGVTPKDSLLMWGWVPELTAYADLKAADRTGHTEYLIRPNPGRAYFRRRLLRDLNGRLPALVVEATRPGFFFANDPDYRPETSGLASFPQLRNIVSANYEALPGPPACPTLYLRRDRVAAWRANEIPLRSSAPALVDNSITEGCNDWWAPPPGAAAIADLTLARPKPIGELWLLASRGGARRDRGTPTVLVTVVGVDGVQQQARVHLFDYPRWTVLPVASRRPVSQIHVRLLDHVGAGPALNEVKALRRDRAAP